MKKPQRPHDPERLGSRIDRKSSSSPFRIELRWLGRGRIVIRDPDNPGWPEKGLTTKFKKTAKKWAAKYDEHYLGLQDEDNQNQTGHYRNLSVAAKLAERDALDVPGGVADVEGHLRDLADMLGEFADPD